MFVYLGQLSRTFIYCRRNQPTWQKILRALWTDNTIGKFFGRFFEKILMHLELILK